MASAPVARQRIRVVALEEIRRFGERKVHPSAQGPCHRGLNRRPRRRGADGGAGRFLCADRRPLQFDGRGQHARPGFEKLKKMFPKSVAAYKAAKPRARGSAPPAAGCRSCRRRRVCDLPGGHHRPLGQALTRATATSTTGRHGTKEAHPDAGRSWRPQHRTDPWQSRPDPIFVNTGGQRASSTGCSTSPSPPRSYSRRAGRGGKKIRRGGGRAGHGQPAHGLGVAQQTRDALDRSSSKTPSRPPGS
jgi:hypothetical protein